MKTLPEFPLAQLHAMVSVYFNPMKTAVFPMALAILLAGCSDGSRGDKWSADPTAANSSPATFSSLDKPSRKNQEVVPTGTINLDNADTEAVLKIYQSISRRTVVRSATLPEVKITLRPEGTVTILKALQLLDTSLALNGIVMIPQGVDMMKAVPPNQAGNEAVPVCNLRPEELPESSSYTHYVVRLKEHRPRDVAQMVQPFAKLPNSILGIDAEKTLVLRDYAVNVRRMLQLIEQLESNDPDKPFYANWFGTNSTVTNATSRNPR